MLFCDSLHQRTGPAPTRIRKEIKERVITRRRALVVGPVNKHRPANHEVAGDEAPVTTVFTVIAIVAHHEITVRRHDEIFLALPWHAERRFSHLFRGQVPLEEVAALFAPTDLDAVTLGDDVAAASALKMCYAAWTKGTSALLLAIRAAAREHGVEAALLEEWARTQPGLPARSRDAAGTARKAWRFAGEMDQIAACFAEAGLPDGFARAAAELYRRLAAFKDIESDPPLGEVLQRVHVQGGTRPWRS